MNHGQGHSSNGRGLRCNWQGKGYAADWVLGGDSVEDGRMRESRQRDGSFPTSERETGFSRCSKPVVPKSLPLNLLSG